MQSCTEVINSSLIAHDSEPGPEHSLTSGFSFHSVHFVGMKLELSSIPYSLTIGHGDRSVRLVEFDQKVHEMLRPCSERLDQI